MKPEVRRFVDAQKRKEIKTVEQMYFEILGKEKRKNKKAPTRGAQIKHLILKTN